MAELKTFLFTDICGSVRLKGEMVGRSVTERDMAFIEQILTPHRQRIEAELAEHGGRVVSTAGDGHFLVFQNTIHAAQWAVRVQESHRDDPIATPNGKRIEVRISIHVGVPQIDPSDTDNFVGKSVDYAARLNDFATGDQILVSRSVMAILDDVALEGLRLHAHGRRPLKGIGAVEVHELLYDDHGPRSLRQQPKSSGDRQWTVVPTQGFDHDFASTRDVRATETLPTLKRVGNYRLEELLGSGGMGDVYRARHLQFDRERAVKVIKPQLVNAGHTEIVRRFYNEIKAVGRLEHKNIVVAIDSSAPEDRVHYLVMEYIEGVGVDELVDQHGPLTVADACEIVRQAARGLQYIHKHDMVHRDIKPSNLMLTLVDSDQVHTDSGTSLESSAERGVIKILDLGLALLVEDNEERLTRFDNKAMGTGMYMSPEQWRTTSVDIRADIYSLGCTLYHLLAGNPPFYDSDLRPEKAHEKSPVPPIRSSAAPVPRKLLDVLKKMLAKEPRDRYAEPSEVAAALAPLATGHDLAALYRQYKSRDPRASSNWRTKVDSPSQVDTLWSRVRQGTGELLASRRWWLGAALPLALFAVFAGAAVKLLQEATLKYRSELEISARQNLTNVARIAADTKIRDELAQRFAHLQESAADDVLRQQLALIDESPTDRRLWEPLQTWLKDRFFEKFEEYPAESWFVNCDAGIQVARIPESNTIGTKLAYRDYFHGQGRNLDENNPSPVEPIQRPNLSAVYKSKSTGKYKVAFSVPVWRDATQQEVLGVLSMSVDLGDFQVLDTKFRGNSDVLLVDLREDSIENQAMHGLILHHPRLGAAKEHSAQPRVDPLVLRAAEAEPSGFVVGYRDVLSDAPGALFWGAYEPVALSLPGQPSEMATRWIVLVQQPMSR